MKTHTSSFKEQITLCFSSHFANKEIERSYLKYLKNDIISSNEYNLLTDQEQKSFAQISETKY